MKRSLSLMLCLFALASVSFAMNDSLNVRTVGSWPYVGSIAVATGHAAGHHVALLHCRGGVRTINVDDPAAPVWMGEVQIRDDRINLFNTPRDIYIQDSLAYMSLGTSGLGIINFADPTHPVLLRQISIPGSIRKTISYTNYLYVADDSTGLIVYNVADPANPVQVNMIPCSSGCWGVARKDSFLFVSFLQDYSPGYIISANITDPANPVIIDSLAVTVMAPSPMSIIISGNYLYTAGFTPIVDISDPYNMVIRSNTYKNGGNGKMAITDTILYTSESNGCLFYNVANPDNVTLIKNYPAMLTAHDVCLDGQILYLSDDKALIIVNVTDPANPTEISHFNTPVIWGRGAITDGYAYMPGDGMHIFNLSDTSELHQTGYSQSDITQISVKDTVAFTSAYWMGLGIFNVADRAHPILVDTLPVPGRQWGLAVQDSFVYCAADTMGVYAINVADIHNPHIIGRFNTPGSAYGVTVVNTTAYVADESGGLRILDVSWPDSITEMGFCAITGGASDVAVRDTLAYVAANNSGLRVINVALPSAPFEVGFWKLSKTSYDGAQAVALDGNLAYVAYDTLGVRVVNIADPANPQETGYYEIATFGAGDGSTLANGVSLWNGKAYVCYDGKGLQAFQYYGPNGITGITNDELRIANSLSPNRPNPFTASTAISYQLAAAGFVTLTVYNVAGQKVRTLASGPQQAGAHEIKWNGRNDAGRELTAGVYFCRLETADHIMTTKMVKIK